MAALSASENVVIFSARYLPNVGGVEFFSANLGRQLASMGHRVVVVTTEPTDDPSADGQVQVGSGTFEVLRLNSWGPTRMPFIRHDRRYKQVVSHIEGLGTFLPLINTRFYSLSRMAARLCKRLGVRAVLIEHGTGYIQFPNPALSLAFKLADHAATTELRRCPIDYYGVSRDASKWLKTFGIDSCGEIHNALDADSFVGKQSGRDFRDELGIAPDALCASYAARLLPEKGADTIIACARKLASIEGLHFFVAGRGPMEQEVAAAAEELPNLTYVGVLSHPDLAALLLQSDVFCLPTRYSEGLPTSLLEAGACGCALVASHAGGVDEIIPSADDGVILGQPTAECLGEVLESLARDPARLAALKESAHRQICERFTWESTAREVLGAFERSSC